MVAGILAGIAWPYQSQALLWLSSFLLALLLTLNVAETSAAETAVSVREQPALAALILFLLFGALPAVQTAAAALLLRDPGYVFGVAAASLAPPAVVVPLFLRHRGGNAGFGLALVVLGTLLCPLAMPPMLALLGVNESFIDTRTVFLTLLPLTLVPVAAGLLLPRLAPASVPRLRRFALPANACLLGLLFFVLVGSAVPRVSPRLWWNGDLPWILALMLWMDFGVYALFRATLGATAATILSARNLAIPASLLLFFDPRAALPSALGFVVHAVFFQWLLRPRSVTCENRKS